MILTVILLMAVILVRGQDNRCFLQGGGSTGNFFVLENVTVGTVLGHLRVIGEVGKDITLKLEDDQDIPVSIDTSNDTALLRLTAPLDKEGLEGPDSVTIDVTCYRVEPEEEEVQGIKIPINIRVTDVNDNAPNFIRAPYVLNISELSLVGSDIFSDILAVDADQQGPFSTVEYHIPNGPFSDYLTFANPLEGKLRLTKSLDYESLQTFTVKLIARDQGSPAQSAETNITIHVEDGDDQNPVFIYQRYEAVIPAHAVKNTKLIVEPEDISAFDRDLGINTPVYYSFSSSGSEYAYFQLEASSGEIYLNSDIPEAEFRHPATLVIKATEIDNPDRYSVATLTVSRLFTSSTGDITFLRKVYSAQVVENMPLNTVILTIVTNRQHDETVRFYIETLKLPGKEFSINQRGEIVLRKQLDYETTEGYSFVVIATDGRSNDSAVVNISVINVNDWDPRFRFPQYEFHVAEEHMDKGHKVGKVDVYDGDKDDTITLDITGSFSRAFGISAKGDIFIRDISYMTSMVAHIVVVAEDSGIPPRRASVPVVVKFGKEISTSRNLKSDADDLTIFLILTLVLFVLLLIIISLGLYICKSKKNFKSSSHASSRINSPDCNSIQHQFPEHIGHNLLTYTLNPMTMTHQGMGPLSISSDRSEVTTASTLSMACSLPQSNPKSHLTEVKPKHGGLGNNKVAPLKPSPSIHQCGLPLQQATSTPECNNHYKTDSTHLQRELKTNILGPNSGVKRLEWPYSSIPRTVKKLSWDDELGNTKDKKPSTFMDVDVSVTPVHSVNRSNGDVVYLR